MVPNFDGSDADVNELSDVLKIYRTIRDAQSHLSTTFAVTLQIHDLAKDKCAWVHSHVLGGCRGISQNHPLAVSLNNAFQCSRIRDGASTENFALCSTDI